MKSLRSFVFCTLLACAPALSVAADKTTMPALSTSSTSPTIGETLAADTPRTTVDGNAFVAPAGWSIRTAGPMVLLTAPEGGSHIALVDVGTAKDADAAVAAAWAAYDPKLEWPLKLASDRPVRGGWEQMRSYQYETADSEARSVSAGARRRGDRWTVRSRHGRRHRASANPNRAALRRRLPRAIAARSCRGAHGRSSEALEA